MKEDLKNDSSNVENTKIELPQLPQPFLIKQEEQNKPWYKKNISIIISLVSLIITAFMSYQTIENNLKNQERNSYLDTTNLISFKICGRVIQVIPYIMNHKNL